MALQPEATKLISKFIYFCTDIDSISVLNVANLKH